MGCCSKGTLRAKVGGIISTIILLPILSLRSNRKVNLIEPSDPSLGITASSVNISDGTMVCSFTRQNSYSNENYFSLSKSNLPYLIVAYGSLSTKGGKRKFFILFNI